MLIGPFSPQGTRLLASFRAVLGAAETNGELPPVITDPNRPNPHEVASGIVLICPLASPPA